MKPLTSLLSEHIEILDILIQAGGYDFIGLCETWVDEKDWEGLKDILIQAIIACLDDTINADQFLAFIFFSIRGT